MSMTHTIDTLAAVTPLRPAAGTGPRLLAYRAHEVEPDAARQPLAHLGWQLEQRLADLWDRQESPYAALVLLGTAASVRACALLNAVFDASVEAAEVAVRIAATGHSDDVFDRYDDALYELVQCLRTPATAVPA